MNISIEIILCYGKLKYSKIVIDIPLKTSQNKKMLAEALTG